MKTAKPRLPGPLTILLNLFALILIAGTLVRAEDQPDPRLRAGGPGEDAIQAGSATDDQLEKLVAPVALYPDALLTKVLDACEHPSEIVAAGDFLHAKQGTVTPDPKWPASITALLHYPNVLLNMDGNLGWATRLGNAWKSQKKDVQDAVNYVRQQAEKAGNLKSNENQTVTDDDGTTTIASPDPNVLYVPQYDPAYLYVPGAFYGGYGYIGAPRLQFARGMAVGAAVASHTYVHGAYPHYHWAAPAAGYGAGVHEGRQQGFAAGAAAADHRGDHPDAAYGAGLHQGRQEGFAAGAAAAGHHTYDTFGGGSSVHYHVHNHYYGSAGAGDRGDVGGQGGGFGGDRGGFQAGGFGEGTHGFEGGAHYGGFHGGGGRRR